MHKIMKTGKSCVVLTSLLVLLSSALQCCAIAIQTEAQAMSYLSKLGYLNLSMENQSLDNNTFKSTMAQALMKFQSFVGLHPTAQLDDETLHYMNKPTCDKVEFATGSRSRRDLQFQKFEVNDLTYKISKYPERLSNSETDSEIRKAFKVWSDVTPLTFTQKQSGEVDITIRFEKDDHGDQTPFDGPLGFMAHAAYPYMGGFAHFDDAELWSTSLDNGTNLLQVAAHEFGHSLGLTHSNDVQSHSRCPLMAADYYSENFDSSDPLAHDDVQRIQALYGARQTTD